MLYVTVYTWRDPAAAAAEDDVVVVVFAAAAAAAAAAAVAAAAATSAADAGHDARRQFPNPCGNINAYNFPAPYHKLPHDP